MKIDSDPRLPQVGSADYDQRLSARLYEIFRKLSQQVNGISEGSIIANTNAVTAAPTTGTWNRGDFVRNSSPSELGSAGSKYVVYGWICTVPGTPGTWLQQRMLTGN